MIRFNNEGITISVELPKTDYEIYMMAMYNKDKDIYITKSYISKNGIDDLTTLNIECELKSDSKNIKYDMANYITDMYYNKKYDYYIDLYEYSLKCFNKGLTLVESENAN